MKKILSLLLFVYLVGCTNKQESIVIEKPVIKQSYSYENMHNNCNTCITSYTIRKPVEVIYENTTYTTVYEPKTYTTVTHERKPYNKCENSDLCY